MLLERNQAVIGVIVAAVVAAGTAFAVLATAGLFVDGEPMQAAFTDAAGLEDGDFVYVGGHRAGTVTGVEIDGDHVLVDFTLTVPEMPADSMAAVTLNTALGRRGLTVVPGTSSQMLEAGSLIPLDRTTTPVDLPELGDRSAELLGELDVPALRELTTALADVTDDSREDVEALLEGVEAVTTIVSDRRDEIEDVLDRATVVVDAVASKDTELVAIIDDFGSVLDRLVDRRADITRLLRETSRTSTLTADLVAERRAQIDRVVESFSEDLAVIDRHQVDLAHTLTYLASGLDGFSSIGYSGGAAQVDNPSWGNVFATNLGSIGIGSLLECGGALDQLFTEVLAPDPRCGEEGVPSQGSEDGPPADDGGQDQGGPAPLIGDLGRGLTGTDAVSRFLGVPTTLQGGGQ
ncbi:MAG: MCE family protein [Nitriliruptor sp.]|uniref:MCE family protein n=1 Tax=Nitriliruptor sp. TaxID=2448056 RepID=UPI0034A0366C